MNDIARSVALVVVSVVLSSGGQTLLKAGLDRQGAGKADDLLEFARISFGSWHVWLGLVLFACSVLVWMRVLSATELSWSYPLLGLSYVVVALSGWLVFGDHLSAARLLGIALVLAGAFLIAAS
ncbi:MAG: 4-amino-4-deoxy-L-arabinose transferase [Coriobacteriia bacterium]|nr:4-amino-4-deoxy-L-arabinose transferase [Coriobacteriia bacterium]